MPTYTYKPKDGIFRTRLYLKLNLYPRRMPYRKNTFVNNEMKVVFFFIEL